jgi:DNA-binding Lrp family transcriptional regulator
MFNKVMKEKGGIHLTSTDVRILEFLLENVTKEFSINKISEAIGISYPPVRERMLELHKRGIINVREINPTQSLCSVNAKNSDNISVFSYVEFLRKEKFLSVKKELKTIADDILSRITGNSFTMILFGSHVKGREAPSSDIDILFLVSSAGDESRITKAVATAERLTNRKIHTITMTYDDFFDSLKKGSATLPKEVLENHIIVYGAEAFYRSLVIYGQI